MGNQVGEKGHAHQDDHEVFVLLIIVDVNSQIGFHESRNEGQLQQTPVHASLYEVRLDNNVSPIVHHETSCYSRLFTSQENHLRSGR